MVFPHVFYFVSLTPLYMDIQTPTQSLLALTALIFEAHSVVLFLVEENGEAVPVAYYNQAGQIDPHARIRPGKGLVGWILRNQEPLLIDNKEESQLGYYLEGQEPPILSFMGYPVTRKDEYGCTGVLCVDSLKPAAFAHSRQAWLHHLAQCIPTIEYTLSEAQNQRESVHYFAAIEKLLDLRTHYQGWGPYISQALEYLTQVTGFEYAAFASRPGDSETYTVENDCPLLLTSKKELPEFALTHGITGWVFRNEEPVYNEGMGNSTSRSTLFGVLPPAIGTMPEFASTLCVPIKVEKSTQAVLSFGSTSPRIISPALRLFLRMAADDMARLLEGVALRYRIKTLTPKAQLHTEEIVPDVES